MHIIIGQNVHVNVRNSPNTSFMHEATHTHAHIFGNLPLESTRFCALADVTTSR